MNHDALCNLDQRVLAWVEKISFPLARFAMFVVFFWFGALKVFSTSPANPLVADLLLKTIPFITFQQFIIFFGMYEMLIGLAFIIPRFERFAILLLIPHMVTTILPLFLLPNVAWQKFLVPTLEGQYMIKNLILSHWPSQLLPSLNQ